MAQKIRIKDIAEVANVSPGTVDRVLHNRGNVSAQARQAIEEALGKLNYRTNIHLSGISLRKRYNVSIVMPKYASGEYWEELYKGILHATHEYDVVNIETTFLYYDQFDKHSFRPVFEELAAMEPDAVIIGPTFVRETLELAEWLENKHIPYSYVDSVVEGTSPLTSFSANQYKCGYLVGRLVASICPGNAEIVLFQMAKNADSIGNSTLLRRNGFMAFFNENRRTNPIFREVLSPQDETEAAKHIAAFFQTHPQVKGAVVLSSRGHLVANYISTHHMKDIKLVCVDLTENNRKAILAGDIDFVVGQRPLLQGFLAFKSIIQYLVYGHRSNVDTFLSLDIIARENIEVYEELIVSSFSDSGAMGYL